MSDARYIIIDETGPGGCEWEYYMGEPCEYDFTKAIVDTLYESDDDLRPEGEHIGHLCDRHIDKAFEGLDQ